MARVYIIFDPAGIWELGPAVFERNEDAAMQAAAYTSENSRSWYPGYYLEVRAFDVVPATIPSEDIESYGWGPESARG